MRGLSLFFCLGLSATAPALAAEQAALAPGHPALAPGQVAKPATVTLDQIRQLLTGTWQSTADTRFTRQLNADGTSIDRYEGDETATSTGTWKLFAGTALPPNLAWRKLPPEGVYMTISEHGDVYLFALTSVAPQALDVINLDRRQAVHFERLK